MKVKNILLLISVIAIISFIFVFMFDLSSMANQEQENQQINLSELPPGQPGPIRPEDRMLQVPLSGVLLLFGLIVFAFYFSYNFLEQNFKKELSVISNIAGNTNEIYNLNSNDDVKDTILNLLNQNERRIVKQLIDNHGVCLQSDISKMNDMGKVKAHRYIQNLSKMGIITIERYGNTNKIKISQNIKKHL